ncbi:SDR family oxidoreductase [Spirosoma soli]|uniref:SDR family oxidoreductase n=1 Tax=Spirosoma soli TaxID=1770529 RepID=A0ABW5M3I1_9BACT
MILVTGATGQLGKAIIEQLLKKTAIDQIAALVRDSSKAAYLMEKGVNVRIGHYDDPDALDKAMQGIEKVLLVSGGDADNGLQQHQNVVDAAKKAEVQCIAYTSRFMKDPNSLANSLMTRHFQTEDYIRESGLNYVLFRNILYMDAIPIFLGPAVLNSGIFLPAGEGRVSFALRSDMGEAMANVLVEAPCDNQVYTFSGAQSYSFANVAATLTELSGKTVTYTPVDESSFKAQMKQRGVPEGMVQRIVDFMIDIKNGQEAGISPDLEMMLGRKPTSLNEGLKLLYSF